MKLWIVGTVALASAMTVNAPAAGAAASRQASTAHRAPGQSGVSDPLAWVRSNYASSTRTETRFRSAGQAEAPDSRNTAYSPRLRAMFADNERYAAGEVGRLEFNPATGAQDDNISGVQVTSRNVEGAPDRRVVRASFRNSGAPTTVNYYFRRIGGRWYVDDISSPGYPGTQGAGPWTLSLVLLYGG